MEATFNCSKSDPGSGKDDQHLIPGIPDEITLQHICTKLPWRELRILSLVSPVWQKVFESRQVYNARARVCSIDTLLVHYHIDFPRVALYSIKDDCCYELPLFPHLRQPLEDDYECSGSDGEDLEDCILEDSECAGSDSEDLEDSECIASDDKDLEEYVRKLEGSECTGSDDSDLDDCVLEGYECIGLDGKIYVLGGVRAGYESETVCAEVFVLDVAGRWKWKHCASMLQPRKQFGCGVSGGKIYVVGGTSYQFPMGGSEVYDPTVDAWSPIMPMPSLRWNHRVATDGDQLLVYGGEIYNAFENYVAHANESRDDYDGFYDGFIAHEFLFPHSFEVNRPKLHAASSLEIYNPMTNELSKRVLNFKLLSEDPLYFANGELHHVIGAFIEFYDKDEDSWPIRHESMFPQQTKYSPDPLSKNPVVVGNELFPTFRSTKRTEGRTKEISLLRTRGYDSGKTELVWMKTSCPCPGSGSRAIVGPLSL